jgi:DNA (cytosine-5)-methyltransferase 1
MKEPLTRFGFIDLFSGAGGFTLGLERAGGDAASFAVESDPDCARTFTTNFPAATMMEKDIQTIRYDRRRRIDVAVAGPPCQGFSTLNRKRDGDPRNLLYNEVIRCTDALRPLVVVVENVASFADSHEAIALENALATRGYAVRVGVVNAADFGVPQRRLRALVTAASDSLAVPWPAPTHSLSGESLPAHRTVADALALLPTEPDGSNWHRDDYRRRSSQIERLRAVREGGSRRDLPPDLVLDCWKETRGYNDVLGRLEWHRPSTTVRTEFFRPEKGRFLHPTEDRPITPREAARLQSFPDSFVFPEEQTLYSVGRQIGNAIPPRLAEAIGIAVAECLAFRPRPRTRPAAGALAA